MYKLSFVKQKANEILDNYKQRDPSAYAAAQEAVGGLLMVDGFIGIDNPLGGKKRAGIFGAVVGIVVGSVFVAIGLFGPNLFGVNKMTGTTTGTVTAVGAPQTLTNPDSSSPSTCSLTATYEVNGKKYTTTEGSTSSGNCGTAVGSTITLNYNPANPGSWDNNAKIFAWVLRAFVLVGALFILSSLVTFVIRLLSIIFGWKIFRSGRALAKTLPGGASPGNLVHDIRAEFSHLLFGNPVPSTGVAAANPLTFVEAKLEQTVNQQPYGTSLQQPASTIPSLTNTTATTEPQVIQPNEPATTSGEPQSTSNADSVGNNNTTPAVSAPIDPNYPTSSAQ